MPRASRSSWAAPSGDCSGAWHRRVPLNQPSSSSGYLVPRDGPALLQSWLCSSPRRALPRSLLARAATSP
jgi:hypothetical protein